MINKEKLPLVEDDLGSLNGLVLSDYSIDEE
jgi:hypothetical protein